MPSADAEGSTAEARREHRRRFWQSMAYLTSVGWMMALPIAAGVLLGHTLDRRLGTGTFWTMALLGAGLVLGAWEGFSAARRILRRRKNGDD